MASPYITRFHSTLDVLLLRVCSSHCQKHRRVIQQVSSRKCLPGRRLLSGFYLPVPRTVPASNSLAHSLFDMFYVPEHVASRAASDWNISTTRPKPILTKFCDNFVALVIVNLHNYEIFLWNLLLLFVIFYSSELTRLIIKPYSRYWSKYFGPNFVMISLEIVQH